MVTVTTKYTYSFGTKLCANLPLPFFVRWIEKCRRICYIRYITSDKGDEMYIEIEPNSVVPIYNQLMTQIKKAVLTHEVVSGDALPSVRSLAGDLGVNMHTVNKAYNLMVEEGILAKNQKGYTIAREETAGLPAEKINELKERMETLLIDTFVQGFTLEETLSWVTEIEQNLKRKGTS